MLAGLRLPTQFVNKTLKNCERRAGQEKMLGRVDYFFESFMPGASGGRALCFVGPTGTGKTHLLTSILRQLALEKGVRGRYEEFFLLLSDIRDGFSKGQSAREWLEPLREVEVLAIDEVGKGGKNREFEQGVLDEIISVRYHAGRPTLLATNDPRARARPGRSRPRTRPRTPGAAGRSGRVYSRRAARDVRFRRGARQRSTKPQAARGARDQIRIAIRHARRCGPRLNSLPLSARDPSRALTTMKE